VLPGWQILAKGLEAGGGTGPCGPLLVLWPGVKNKIFYFLTPTPTNANFPCTPQQERIMPKGTIRNPGSKKPMLSVKTWSGKQLPLRSKTELEARFKNMNRTHGEDYPRYARERDTARDVRADKSVRTKAKKTIRPATSAKKGAK
jgi:hypothetical protein